MFVPFARVCVVFASQGQAKHTFTAALPTFGKSISYNFNVQVRVQWALAFLMYIHSNTEATEPQSFLQLWVHNMSGHVRVSKSHLWSDPRGSRGPATPWLHAQSE